VDDPARPDGARGVSDREINVGSLMLERAGPPSAPRASSAYGREEFDQLFEALPLRHARWSRPRSSPDCAGESSPNSGYAIPPSRMNRCGRLG
jgi:hypothetical protein